MATKAIFIGSVLAAGIQAGSDGKCRALVMSGGANNGVWESGVIWGLAHYGNPADFAWDVATGVSAGGINTGLVAVWAPGSEVEMSEWIAERYAEISSSDIWTLRPGSVYDLFFKEQSLLDDSSALATIKEFIGMREGIERRFVISAVDVNYGEYTPMTQEDTTFEQLPQTMLSSGSIPTVFPPQQTATNLFMDGGTAWNVNLDSAVQQCLEVVDNEKDIIVDILITRTYTQPTSSVEKNAIDELLDARQIRKYYTGFNSLFGQARAYPDINFRYYFQEHRHTCPGNQLDFNNSTTWCLQEQGRADAKAMLDLGQENIGQTLEEWNADQELKKEWPLFRDYLDYIYKLF